jgi:hypothetical protein
MKEGFCTKRISGYPGFVLDLPTDAIVTRLYYNSTTYDLTIWYIFVSPEESSFPFSLTNERPNRKDLEKFVGEFVHRNETGSLVWYVYRD